MATKTANEFNREKLKAWLDEGDGHSIYAPQHFLDIGFPADLVQQKTHKHGGSGGPKERVFDKHGQEITLVGVHGLDLIRHLANRYGVSSTKLGRGSEARDLAAKLIQKLKL